MAGANLRTDSFLPALQSSGTTNDPYSYPGTNILKNKLNLSNAGALATAENAAFVIRYAALETAPGLGADGFLALHAQLFGAIYDWAGQIRITPSDWDGRYFAQCHLIKTSLERQFAAFARVSQFKPLTRDEFFDALAHHASELHAISPFRRGNRRTIALHAAQCARAAGYAVQTCELSRTTWDEVLLLGFVHKDHRGIAHLLKGTPIPVDLFPQAVLGIGGLPQLPNRDTPSGRRYLRTIPRILREIEDDLPAAHDQAAARLAALVSEGAAPGRIETARQELAFLRHPKGALFQAALLEASGHAMVTPAIDPDHSALERVREIAAAIIVGINQQPRGLIERLINEAERAPSLASGSPHQDRLAAEFLGNTAEQNYTDPRFAAGQRAVDEISVKAKRVRAADPARIAVERKRARHAVAARIRSGDMMVADGTAKRSPRATQAR